MSNSKHGTRYEVTNQKVVEAWVAGVTAKTGAKKVAETLNMPLSALNARVRKLRKDGHQVPVMPNSRKVQPRDEGVAEVLAKFAEGGQSATEQA